MKFTISGTLPSMNEIIKHAKVHYGKYSRVKKEWTEYVAWYCKGDKIKGRVNVKITWYQDMRIDPDNVSAGAKFILDGLVMSGVLGGDSYKYIGSITHIFIKDKDNPRIEIELGEGEE